MTEVGVAVVVVHVFVAAVVFFRPSCQNDTEKRRDFRAFLLGALLDVYDDTGDRYGILKCSNHLVRELAAVVFKFFFFYIYEQ